MNRVRKTIVLDDDNYLLLVKLAGMMTQTQAKQYTLSKIVNLIVDLLNNLKILQEDFDQNVLDVLISSLELVDREIKELNLGEHIELLRALKQL